jgi:hypothetical protein
LIGRRTGECQIRLAVTASTFSPLLLDLGPDGGAWPEAIDRLVAPLGWYDDIHGEPAWRRAMTHLLGEEILAELLPGSATGVDAAIGRVTGDLHLDRSAR